MVSTFVTTVSHLIRDPKEATQGIHTNGYYIEKLNTTFFVHKDMVAHIWTMETQDAMLSRRLGTTIAPRTHEDHLRELLDYTTLLDNWHSKAQAQKHSANNSNVSNSNRTTVEMEVTVVAEMAAVIVVAAIAAVLAKVVVVVAMETADVATVVAVTAATLLMK